MAVIFSGKEKRLIRVVVLLTSQKGHHEKNSVVDIFYLWITFINNIYKYTQTMLIKKKLV